MRVMILAAALIVAACGPSTESSDDVPDPTERALPLGTLVASGETWTLTASPADNAVSFSAEDGTESSGTWTPPVTVDGGYTLTSGDITLVLRDGACAYSATPFPMSATLSVGDQIYAGCAAMRWDYQLIALMPQIDACIARSPEARWVSYAGVQADGSVLVRLTADGGGFDCNVSQGAAPQIVSFAPRSEALLVATDHAAIFVRGPGENPGGECYDAPEVRGANDELLGWMMDPLGC